MLIMNYLILNLFNSLIINFQTNIINIENYMAYSIISLTFELQMITQTTYARFYFSFYFINRPGVFC